MRVGILCLMQESNTFLNKKTELHDFESDLLLEGNEIKKNMIDAHHEVGGFLEGLENAGIEAVPIFAARALPYGTIKKQAFDQLIKKMFSLVEKVGPLDGYLVAPHGATVSEQYPDADGYWLSKLRKKIGLNKPIIGTLDLHANLSKRMVESTNALIGYRSNPHLDQRARGIEAAALIVKTLRREINPVQIAAYLPFIMNIEKQCTEISPCKEIFELATELRKSSNLHSLSVLQGYPYADVEEMGTSLVAVGDYSIQPTLSVLQKLSQELWNNRASFDGEGISLEKALYSVRQNLKRTCLLDMGDNIGGGSPADGTMIAEGLLKQRIPRSFVCLYDPESVEISKCAGVGSKINLEMGGKVDDSQGSSLASEVTVQGLFDGIFHERTPRHGGFTDFDQGKTAVVFCKSGLTVMLTSKRMAPFSLEQLRSCKLNPFDFNVLVAKGVNSPISAYREVCSRFIRVDTPGITASNLNNFNYLNRRKPMYPFEQNFEWEF